MGAGRIPHYQVGGEEAALWSPGSRLPSALGQGQGQARALCREVASEDVCPLLWEGAFAVRPVRGIFMPLIQPRQDLVHKFSRGNAFNKNLMGSGSFAASPHECQVCAWSLACARATGCGRPSSGGGGGFEQGPPPSAPCFPGEGQACSPGSGGGGPLRAGAEPQGPGQLRES